MSDDDAEGATFVVALISGLWAVAAALHLTYDTWFCIPSLVSAGVAGFYLAVFAVHPVIKAIQGYVGK